MLKARIFMHFRRVLIEDFRGFSQISRFSTLFVHAFERFHVVNGFQMRSFCDSLHGSDQFSDKSRRNADAWCKGIFCSLSCGLAIVRFPCLSTRREAGQFEMYYETKKAASPMLRPETRRRRARFRSLARLAHAP